MGLLNKLKNAIFEEEEIEINEPVEEVIKEKEPPRVVKKKEPVKMTFDSEEDDLISDRELFKAEPTFNFPAFDEREFEVEKKEKRKEEVPVKKEVEKPIEVKTRSTAPSVLEMERTKKEVKPKETKRNYDYKEARKVKETQRNENKRFIPSPVISPVYGVLDKNYKKEDIVVKLDEKKLDVDSVRKKAFGTLEDDIEKTLNTSKREFYKKEKAAVKYQEEGKHLDDLLESVSEEVIPVTEKEETNRPDPSFNIEEESIRYRKERKSELERLDRPNNKTVEEKLEDETLENDLFDLIDSMYETREDGE